LSTTNGNSRAKGFPARLAAIIGTCILIVAGAGMGFVLSELAYRIYLVKVAAPQRFERAVKSGYAVNDKPMWIYDEQFGYVYPKGDTIGIASISGGKVTACSSYKEFNREGNVGKIVGDYAAANVKILAFGDSFTATSHNGITWPLLLQERLAKRLGRTVNVVNYGRDGTGLLQMFDMAAAKTAERKPKPDLAIIAFITNDLQRVRFWRAVTKVDGHWRHLVSPEPTPNPDPAKSYDTAMYHPEATPEWCRKMKETGQRDHVITELDEVYNSGIGVGEERSADVFSLRHSYLIARVLHGDPFRGIGGRFLFPVVNYDTYAEDLRLMKSIKELEASGVPYVLFHFAFYPEFKAGREYIMNHDESRLLKSLEQVTGKRIFETTPYIDLPVPDPERLIQSPDNFHPSLPGLELYADAMAEMLVREGYLK
jgi:lysophospholipase L1-like esterase